MKTLANILWLVLAGFWLFLGYVLAGVVNCIFIITIPFGIQSFKLAGYALWLFGRVVVYRQNRDVALGVPRQCAVVRPRRLLTRSGT